MLRGTLPFRPPAHLFFLIGVIALTGLRAQETRGTIQGRIVDPSGSGIPGATIQIANEGTNVSTKTQSDSQGDFAAPFLPPGFYRLTITATGFKNYTRSGAELRIDERLQLDVKLEIGDASQQVTVTAAVPVTDTASANLGQVVDSRSAAELPTPDGSPFSLVYLSPGIIYTYPGSQGDTPQGSENGITQSNFYGTQRGSTEFTIDGVPNTQNSFADYGTGVLDSPPGDIVQEFKLETAFDASAGHTSGVIVNFVLKGGTNQLHATAYAIDKEPSMVANNWFSNRAGQPLGHFLYHRWGATTTGPVVIPKLYNGHNRTFFTFGYEGSKTLGAVTPYIVSMPTVAERQGNFSALLALGPQYQIYDPATIHPYTTAGRYTSNPFPGNIIPASRFSPVGAALLSYFPIPNLTTGGPDGSNNWGSFASGISGVRSYYNYIGRVDHNFSEKQRLTVRVAANLRKDGPYRQYWPGPADGLSWNGPAKQAAVDDLFVLSPTLIFDIRYGLNRYQGGHVPSGYGFNAATLGYSPAIAAELDAAGAYFPTVNVAGVGDKLGTETPNIYDSVNQSLILAFSKTAGVHNLKFGADIRAYQNNIYLPGRSSGNYTFDSTYTRGPLDDSASSPSSLGQGVAALLLGIPTSGSIDRNSSQALTSQYQALYFQDNWRVNSKLTLDLGLRWEHEPPETERFNRAVNGFDSTATLSITNQALANYAAHPDASIPVSQFQVLGGLEYSGVDGRSRGFWESSWKVFAPRFGAAYSVSSKLVIRAGFGVFPMEKGLTATAANAGQSAQNWAIQSGYSQSTTFIPTTNNGQAFIATIDNPFPNGLQAASGNSLGVNTFLGQAITLYNGQPRTPYEMFATLNAQYRLPGDVLLEVGGVSNKAVKIEVNRNIDALPDEYLSSAYRNNTTISYLSQTITNPFVNLLPGSTINSSTIARSKLLQPYPQFTSITMTDYQGSSEYNGLQVRLHKRFSGGITVIGSYGFSKLMEANTYLNAGDPAPSRYISPIDRPENLSFASIFELPVGHGRWLLPHLNRIADGFIGGWQLGAIWNLTSGGPLNFGNVIINNLNDVNLPSSQRTVKEWFNTSDFNTNSSQQPSDNLRTLSPYFSSIRAGVIDNWNMNLMKNIPIHERLQLQFRLDAINVFNHPSGWAPPDTTPTDLTFGQVTSLYSVARQVSMELKLRF